MTTKPVMAVCGLVIRPPYGHQHPGVAQHIEQRIAPQTDTRLPQRRWIDPVGLTSYSDGNEAVLGLNGDLRKEASPGQSHHLNQEAAYRDVIPTNKGAAIKLEGNAFTAPGTPHYEAHKSFEVFWSQYR